MLILLLLIALQEPLPVGHETGANLPAQKIGANDLLAITVYGAPELTRTVRVSDDGLIRLPMLKQKIAARGVMPADLEKRITTALVAEEILVDPAVTVNVAEYHSRPISVVGAVHRPLTFQAWGKTTLLEAIARAEGLSSDAGTEILVTRPPDPTRTIAVKSLIDDADAAANITLEGGEEVRVPQAGRVFVVGNVKKPGTFRIEDSNGLTVLKALAMAEGLSPFAAKEAYLYRRGAASGEEVPVDLRKILDRKSPDVALSANDIFYIPDNRKGRMTATVLEKTLGFAASTASGILILSRP
jgi:polysaccharide export outer membrane protein